jgi:hypothetical protein
MIAHLWFGLWKGRNWLRGRYSNRASFMLNHRHWHAFPNYADGMIDRSLLLDTLPWLAKLS